MNTVLAFNIFQKRVDSKLHSDALLARAIIEEIDELIAEIKKLSFFKLTISTDPFSLDYFKLSTSRARMPHNSDAVYALIKHDYDKIMFEMADLVGLLYTAKQRGAYKHTSLANFVSAVEAGKIPKALDVAVTRGFQILRLVYTELHFNDQLTFRDFIDSLLHVIVVKANFRYSAAEHLVNIPIGEQK